MADADDIYQALRDARPSWSLAEATHHTPEQPVDKTNIRRWDLPTLTTIETPTVETISSSIPTPEDVTATQTNEYSFELEVASINTDDGQVDIHVGYGEINDTPPTGMTGADDYTLTISLDGTEIYAIITYDTDTLEITSRSLAFGSSVPDSTFGTLYVGIGFVDINYDPDTGKISEVNPHNRHCGDINVSFLYGAANAAPAVFTLAQFAGPQPLS